MVTKSTINYHKHKDDIEQILIRKKPKLAKNFIDFYSDRFDKHGRSFIDYKLALALYDDYIGVSKKNGMAWYAVLGVGGSGKTTISKNCSYFLDNSFSIDRVKTELLDIIKMFKKYGMTEAKSYVLDEPDLNVNSNSKGGRIARNVFGKARQQKAFMFFCATDFSDIPNFIYKKINRIIFCVKKGKAMLMKDIPQKKIYFIGKLKKEYTQKLSYEVFFNPMFKKYALCFDSSGYTPLSKEQEKEYDRNKKKDYNDTLLIAEKILTNQQKSIIQTNPRDLTIWKMHQKGMTNVDIGSFMDISDARVSQIVKQIKHKNIKEVDIVSSNI